MAYFGYRGSPCIRPGMTYFGYRGSPCIRPGMTYFGYRGSPCIRPGMTYFGYRGSPCIRSDTRGNTVRSPGHTCSPDTYRDNPADRRDRTTPGDNLQTE